MKGNGYPLCPAETTVSKERFLELVERRPFWVKFRLLGGPNQIRRLTGSPKKVILRIEAGSGQIGYNEKGRGTANFFGFVDGDRKKCVSFTISIDTRPNPRGSIACMYL